MSFKDLKTSILVNRQLPEFVRDEYPKFITFLEAYYEFLEQSGTTPTSNNLVTKAKSLREISDVDISIDDFEINFYNTYAALVPLDVQSNKALLFKHLANLYRSKGNESSFKLLFQLIFGEDPDIILPKNNVLRASASNWQIDNSLKVNPNISSRYVGNGTAKTFYLAQIVSSNEFSVFVDGVLKTPNIDYFVNKEFRQLNFVTAPVNGSEILATYNNFNFKLLENRRVTGITSKAFAIIETANKRTISDVLNLGLPIELLIDQKSLRGSFLNGEQVTIPINDEVNNISIDIRASTFSIVRKLNLVNSGNNYSVGDIVTVSGGNASVNAFGTVERVFSGKVDSVAVHHGGAIFSISSPIAVSGNSSLTTMIAVVDAIDTTGANAANSFTVSPDVVANLSLNVDGTVYVNSSNWGAVFGKANLSAANTIASALNYITVQAGPITNVKVLTSVITLTEKDFVALDAAGAEYGNSNVAVGAVNSPRFSKSLKSIGRYKINDGGINYKVGDEIVFGPNPLGTYGQMAAATVSKIAANGYILRVDSANSRIRGTVSVNAACNEIIGTGTFFTQDLKNGDVVDVNNESRIVTSTPTDTTAVVSSTFTYNALDKKLGVYNRWPLGGYGYTQNNFPSISVLSTTGSGANVQIDSLVGDGERLAPTGFGANGQIVSIKVVNPGSGYEYNPIVSISGGDGSATAVAEIERSYSSAEGRWTTSDSIISSFERKLQGEDFYVDYSYVVSSTVEFSLYKKLLKELLHPVGLVNYSFYNKQDLIELTDVSVDFFDVGNTISGTVNVGNGRISVTGNSTKYNIANSLGILSLGSSIAVNGELRTINTILSNTELLTTSNITSLTVANSGSGYSNGYLLFSDGGGQVTSLSITANGSGYENGFVTFSGTDEAIAAVANVEVYASNGAIRSLTLVSGGLYSNTPVAMPDSNPHRVLYANGISIVSRGEGYSNGWLVFSGGGPLREANVAVEVYPSNGAIRSFIVYDSGLYQSNPTVRPDSNANVVVSAVTVNSVGNGHSNGVLTLSGGNPARPAVVAVETFPPGSNQIMSITANGLSYGVNSYLQFVAANGNTEVIAANARMYVNDVGAVVNVVISANGLYTGVPTVTANSGNASFYVGTGSVKINSVDGQIRKITIVDPGRYSTTPTAVLNTTPVSIVSVAANSATYNGVALANGQLVFTGGDPVIPADITYEVFASNGVIRTITVNHAGLYRVPPSNVTTNITPVSITEALTLSGGSGYVNGYIVFSTTQGTANIAANAFANVTGGAITSTTMRDVGLYANGADIIIVGILNPATGALQTPATTATFRIGYNANTTNIANLTTITTTTNVGQTASVTITTSSNVYTNAVVTVTTVANSQTNAVISVGFTGRNTAANVSVEVYDNSSGLLPPSNTANGTIVKLTINNPGNYYYTPNVTPNSVGSGAVITFNKTNWTQTANAQTAVIFK
jgi:hypothetical protein